MIDAAHLALIDARDRILDRLHALRANLDAGHDCWAPYLEAVAALVAVEAHLTQQRGERVLTSAELGEKFGLSAKTAARKARNGELPVSAIPLGRGGRGQAIRWRERPA